MLIEPAALSAINVGFNAIFQQGWERGGENLIGPKLATQTNSSHASSIYGGMAEIPRMREWLGPRIFHNLEAHAVTITNRTFEDSVRVSREEIEDEQLGWSRMKIEALGQAGAMLPDDLVRAAIQGNPAGFDGLSFFNDAHDLDPIGGVQDNTLALALTAANYATARATMMAFCGRNGEPLGVMPDLMVVPPQLEGVARLTLNADMVPSTAGTASESNIWKGSADLLVVPEFADAPTRWFLFATKRPLKPYIWQIRRPVQLVSRTNLDSDNVFTLNQFEWGIDGRGEVGPGPWFLGLRSTG